VNTTGHVAEAVFAGVGGISSVRWIIHRIFWAREQYKAVLKLQATRRGYNIAYAQHQHPSSRRSKRKQPPVDPKVYTIPDDGNSK
jgi:hypothetical protein